MEAGDAVGQARRQVGRRQAAIGRADGEEGVARLLARRATGRPYWPLGAFKGEYAVDTVAIGRKPA